MLIGEIDPEEVSGELPQVYQVLFYYLIRHRGSMFKRSRYGAANKGNNTQQELQNERFIEPSDMAPTHHSRSTINRRRICDWLT